MVGFLAPSSGKFQLSDFKLPPKTPFFLGPKEQSKFAQISGNFGAKNGGKVAFPPPAIFREAGLKSDSFSCTCKGVP